MPNHFTVLIPSKGRPECPTAKLLDGQDFKIIVEPQDLEAYKKIWGGKRLLLLPEDNFGLRNVRNWYLDYAEKNNLGWTWVMDDDLTNFYQTAGKNNVRCNFQKVRDHVEPLLRKSNKFAIAALEYQQFAWSMNGRMPLNSYCDTCVIINMPLLRKLGIKYDVEQFKEDRDIVLQVLSKGSNSIRFSKFSFAAPENGSNAGGLHELYKQKSPEREGAFKLAEKWGEQIATVNIKPNGRVDAKINWKHFDRKKK